MMPMSGRIQAQLLVDDRGRAADDVGKGNLLAGNGFLYDTDLVAMIIHGDSLICLIDVHL